VTAGTDVQGNKNISIIMNVKFILTFYFDVHYILTLKVLICQAFSQIFLSTNTS